MQAKKSGYNRVLTILLIITLYFSCTTGPVAQIHKYSLTSPEDIGFDSRLIKGFGTSVKTIPDLNKDGIRDIIFTARSTSFGLQVPYGNSFWIGYMNSEGKLDSATYIREEIFDLLPDTSGFNFVEVDAGDFDGNGTIDFALGSYYENISSDNNGVVMLMLMEQDQSISELKILTNDDFDIFPNLDFGDRVFNIGDLDSDGIDELCVSLRDYEVGARRHGALLIIFFDENANIKKSELIINDYVDVGPSVYGFGTDVKGKNDINGDGNIDLLLGIPHGGSSGTIIILYLDEEANVLEHHTFDPSNLLPDNNFFWGDAHLGESVSVLGDLDGDNISEIMACASWNNYGIDHIGLLFAISFDKDGNLRRYIPLFDFNENPLNLVEHDHLGDYLDTCDDLDGDGFPDLVACKYEGYDYSPGSGKIATIFSDYSYLLDGLSTQTINNIPETFSVYPNPFSHEFMINPGFQHPYSLEIRNISGQLLYNSKEQRIGNASINLHHLKPGFLWIKVIHDNSSFSYPIIKIE